MAKKKRMTKRKKTVQFGPIFDPARAGKRGRGRPRGKSTQYGPVYDPSKAGRRGRGRPRGSKGKMILKPLKGKHKVILKGEIFIKD